MLALSPTYSSLQALRALAVVLTALVNALSLVVQTQLFL